MVFICISLKNQFTPLRKRQQKPSPDIAARMKKLCGFECSQDLILEGPGSAMISVRPCRNDLAHHVFSDRREASDENA
jgi:hypothetical protein